MSFSTRIVVRFGEVDLVGFVYYPRLLHYCHVAFEEFVAARCGSTYAQLCAQERLGFPTVNIQAEFFAPLNYGDEVEITVAVARLGRSSVTFTYSLRRVSDETLCVRADIVQVAMNLDSFRPVEIPARYRAAFAAVG
jgi:4-hydroxybenzoyl-CoA thioesterase